MPELTENDNIDHKVTDLDFKRAFSTLEVKEADDSEYFTLEGYASTFGNVDRANDILAKGAFQKTLMERMPKLLNQHKMDDPLGVIDRAFEDDQGLFITARMPKANSKVQDIMPLIKMGAIGDFSIGFKVVDAEMDNDGVRTIKEADLWEVSVVTIPANPQARILEAKAVTPFQDFPLAPRDRDWEARGAAQRIRAFSDSGTAPSASYRNFFLWYDANDPENFGAYKLPYVDIIDGEPHTVVNALVAAKAAIGGARGGVDIPDADKDDIVRNIDRYLQRVGVGEDNRSKGKEEDRKSNKDDHVIGIKDIEDIKSKRELEALFKQTGCFTNKAAIYASSLCTKLDEKADTQEQPSEPSSDHVKKELEDLLGWMKS